MCQNRGKSGEFVLNLTNEAILKAVDMCGVKSGRDADKWKLTGLTPENAKIVKAPLVKESPVSIECRVVEVKKLGSHDMFMAEVVSVDADEKYFDRDGHFNLNAAGLIAYSHGDYLRTGEKVGNFGYSVKKKKCEVQKKCGGCSYINVPYEKQLSAKQEKLEKLLGVYGRVEPIIGMNAPYYYRNKVHHVFDYDKKTGTVSGVYQENTHNVVPVEECLIEDKKCQEIIEKNIGFSMPKKVS